MSSRTLAQRAAPPGPLVVARSAAFNVAASIWTLASVLVAGLCLLLPPAAILAVSRVWMAGLQFLLRHLVGLDYEVRGLENMPQGPAIYAFKHQSAWETVVIHLLLPNGGDRAQARAHADPLVRLVPAPLRHDRHRSRRPDARRCAR